MTEVTEPTTVIFRMWERDVIAIFPEEEATLNIYECMSYQHVGQHGACNPYYIVQNSRLATQAEYLKLLGELEAVGYRLRIRRKMTQSMHDKRIAAVRKHWTEA